MKRVASFSAVVLLGWATVVLCNQPGADARSQAIALYACKDFFSHQSESQRPGAARSSARRLAKIFQRKAAEIDTSASAILAFDYRAFEKSLEQLDSKEQRTQRVQDFISSCSRSGNTPITFPPEATLIEGSPRELYVCFFVSNTLRTTRDDALVNIMTTSLRRAFEKLSDVSEENRQQIKNLAKDDAKKFMATVEAIPTEEERRARTNAFRDDCASRVGVGIRETRPLPAPDASWVSMLFGYTLDGTRFESGYLVSPALAEELSKMVLSWEELEAELEDARAIPNNFVNADKLVPAVVIKKANGTITHVYWTNGRITDPRPGLPARMVFDRNGTVTEAASYKDGKRTKDYSPTELQELNRSLGGG